MLLTMNDEHTHSKQHCRNSVYPNDVQTEQCKSVLAKANHVFAEAHKMLASDIKKKCFTL